MTKGNFFRYYNKLAGCHKYLIFFGYGDSIYLAETEKIMPRWCVEGHESTSKGGHQKFRMSMKNKHKEELLRKGATKVFTKAEFSEMPYGNKGHNCEWWLHQVCDLGTYKPDRERFDKCGDVCINGIEYQVKFENASLTNVNTLHNAQKDARERNKKPTAADTVASWLNL